MSNQLNITVDQGADFRYRLTIKSEDDPIDLTGYTFRSQARESYSSSAIAFSFSFTILDQTASTGQVDWSLPNTVLLPLVLSAKKTYFYDVEMTSPLNVITSILKGEVTVSPTVTKP